MDLKAKKCKGIGKAIKYNSCGEMALKRTYGLCNSCYKDWLLNSEEGKKKLASSIILAKNKVKKEIKKKAYKEKKEWKDQNKSIQRLIQDARKPFQKYIRLKDENKPCISCGNHYAEIFDAGHYFKAELYSGMIFDERNVHKQCRKCNSILHGNESNYRIGLMHRYGEKFVLELENDAIFQRDKKFTREELLSIKEYYQNKLKNGKV
jgi:hypothetical protein